MFTILPTLLAVVLAVALPSAQQRATPRLDTFERIDTAAGPLWTLRERDRGVGWVLGAAFVCRDSARVQVVVYLGPFPPGRRPVQLAVRTPDGEVARFGRVIVAGPESGFHNISLELPQEQRDFVSAALRSGSLISNGFTSFWNVASDAENAAVVEGLVACGL